MSVTLTSIISQVRSNLGDPDAIRYSNDELTASIREALARFSHFAPCTYSISTTVPASAYYFSLAAYASNLINVVQIQYPVEAGAAITEAILRDWYLVFANGGPLIFRFDAEFEAGKTIQIWYTGNHSLIGLDDAEATTIPPQGDLALIVGATAYAALTRYQRIAELDGVASSQRLALKTTFELWLAKFEIMLANFQRIASLELGPLPAYGWELPTPNEF